jgi:hypothetical protein
MHKTNFSKQQDMILDIVSGLRVRRMQRNNGVVVATAFWEGERLRLLFD